MPRNQGDNNMVDDDDHALVTLPQIPLLDVPLCPSSPRDLRRVRCGITDLSECNTNTLATISGSYGEPSGRFVLAPVRSPISATTTNTTERNSNSTRSSYYFDDDTSTSVYATPTRSSYRTSRWSHPTTTIRRGCSSGNSAAATVVNGRLDNVMSRIAMGGRVRSGTWSGTTSNTVSNLEAGCASSHPSCSAATTTANPISSSGGMDVPDQALIRGDLSWICRQCPRISGSVSMQVNLNVSRMKRFLLAFLYLVFMSVCFNVAFQKIVTMKEPFIFFDKAVPHASTSSTTLLPVDSTERSPSKGKLQGKSHDLRLDHKYSVVDNGDKGNTNLPKSYTLPKETDTSSINISHNNHELHTAATFYAKAGLKRPLYAGGETVTLELHSQARSPSTTNAFFGLIAVICLTSAIFVKGVQEAHTRWNEVRSRYEQSRRALMASAMESSSNVFIGA